MSSESRAFAVGLGVGAAVAAAVLLRRRSSTDADADARHTWSSVGTLELNTSFALPKTLTTAPVAKEGGVTECTVKRVVCYGDSNTWGYDAFAQAEDDDEVAGFRYGEATRWPKVAAAILGAGFAVVEEGLNGRTTVHADPLMESYEANGRATMPAILHSHKPIDLVVLMLGTNDLKSHLSLSPAQIGRGAAILASDVAKMGLSRTAERPRVLLVAPPLAWDKPDWGFVDARKRSAAFAKEYKAQAEQLGCYFLDAAAVFAIPDPAHGGDGIHLSPQNCADLGAAVAGAIREAFEGGARAAPPSLLN